VNVRKRPDKECHYPRDAGATFARDELQATICSLGRAEWQQFAARNIPSPAGGAQLSGLGKWARADSNKRLMR
jgi:hypothetical protein